MKKRYRKTFFQGNSIEQSGDGNNTVSQQEQITKIRTTEMFLEQHMIDGADGGNFN